MKDKKGNIKKCATLKMRLSTFELPPSGDILVLSKRCPLGTKAAKRMLDSVAQGQFELVEPDDNIIESIFCRIHLFKRVDKKKLIKAIIEESKAIMGPQCMLTIECEIDVSVKREIS